MLNTSDSEGRYSYYCNGDKAAITECWHREAAAEGRSRIRARREVDAIAAVLSVEAELEDKAYRRVQLDWTAGKHSVTAEYSFAANAICLKRQVDGQSLPEQTWAETLFFPLLRVFAGPLISRLALLQAPANVLVPSLKDPGQPEQLLSAELSSRTAELVDSGEWSLVGAPRPAKCYRYEGGPYQAGTLFWLDEHDLLLSYRWQSPGGEQWECRLE